MELIKVYQEATGWSDACTIVGLLTIILGLVWFVIQLTDDFFDKKWLAIPVAVFVIGITIMIIGEYLPERTLETYHVTDQKQYLQMLNNGCHEYSSDELTVTIYRDDK